MNLKFLIEEYHKIPKDRIRRLEKTLPLMCRNVFFDNPNANNRMNQLARGIYRARRSQKFLDEFPPKRFISPIEETKRDIILMIKNGIIESIDQASIDVVAYRPHNIEILIKQKEDLLSIIKEEPRKFYREFYKIRSFGHRSRFGYGYIRDYFALNDYHDRFAYEICRKIREKELLELDELLTAGFEHIIWTNVCEAVIKGSNQFSPMFLNSSVLTSITPPSYPQEFFEVLKAVDVNLPLLKDVCRECPRDFFKGMTNQLFEDVLHVGRYRRVGRSPFNVQKLRQKCVDYLELLSSDISQLIENYYLDRQLDVYVQNLLSMESLIISSFIKKDLIYFQERVKMAIVSLPVANRDEAFGILQSLQKADELLMPKFPRYKAGLLEEPLGKYWSILKRKSLNYIAATLLIECLCHIRHDFPSDKWGDFKRLGSTRTSIYDIPEIPSKQIYISLAKTFGLSSRTLEEYHKSTIDVCRSAFKKEFKR